MNCEYKSVEKMTTPNATLKIGTVKRIRALHCTRVSKGAIYVMKISIEGGQCNMNIQK